MPETTHIARDDALTAVTRYLEAIANATSPRQIAALYAEGATLEDPVGSTAIRGHEAISDFFTPLTQARRETELLTFRHAGDSAAFRFRVRTHTPDGVVEIEPIDVMTFTTDGRIATAMAYWSPEDVRMP